MKLNSEEKAKLIHHLIRSVILSGFAFLIVYLVRSDNLSLYIAPRMAVYVKISAIALYAIAVYQLYAALQTWMGRQHAVDCDCGHDHSPSVTKNALIYAIFIFPLALGFLLPDTMMGSSLADKKGMNLSGAPNITRSAELPSVAVKPPLTIEESTDTQQQQDPPQQAENLDAMFPSDIYTESYAKYGKQLYQQDFIQVEEKQFIETLTTLDLYREHYVGKTVQISGFIYRESEMNDEQFVISRFAMNCCSADALPYGLMIQYPKASNYNNDTWLQVTGTLNLTEYNGNTIILIEAKQLQAIPAPDSPYVYPDYDFGL